MKKVILFTFGMLFLGLVGAGCFGGDEVDDIFEEIVENGGWPSDVTYLEIGTDGTVSHDGNLSEGETISLNFASTSSMACFPATENINFNGGHVFYATQMPPHSILTVTVEPKTPGLDVSLYAYQIGTTSNYTPKNVPSAVTCEAGYDAQTDSNPDEAESVEVNTIKNPYNVVIGVAGADSALAGEYTLRLELAQ
jgi:hypothetical protein